MLSGDQRKSDFLKSQTFEKVIYPPNKTCAPWAGLLVNSAGSMPVSFRYRS